ncbi:hypothetical protein AVEN_132358-1 [Araneus ventricosus]|uniref:Uncharacterized protein n=1 Tax=Araneus ventricosus TaxID=182803 RepID=A0A4Y2MSJ8_ARAVE|nr:hypothetical protein AVEN_132358-1 [Araneus ventricosus]
MEWSGTRYDIRTVSYEIHENSRRSNTRPRNGRYFIKMGFFVSINMKVSEVLKDFCEKSFVSSEQHVEFRPSRESRVDSDLVKLYNWLQLHNPLNVSCPKHLLINIASGLVADDKTNCGNARDVEEKLLSSIAGGSFWEVKLQREKRVTPISATSNTLIIRNESVEFNPLQLFARIAAVQFNIPQLDLQKVIEIGEVLLKHLFGGKQINSLDELQCMR